MKKPQITPDIVAKCLNEDGSVDLHLEQGRKIISTVRGTEIEVDYIEDAGAFYRAIYPNSTSHEWYCHGGRASGATCKFRTPRSAYFFECPNCQKESTLFQRSKPPMCECGARTRFLRGGTHVAFPLGRYITIKKENVVSIRPA